MWMPSRISIAHRHTSILAAVLPLRRWLFWRVMISAVVLLTPAEMAADRAAQFNQAQVQWPAHVSRGLLSEKDVDTSLSRIIEARIRMGEFDPPGYEGNPYNKITADMIDTEENNALARKVADETMVLLKNANKTLPLKTNLDTIAVLGPNADAARMQNGNYSGTPSAQHQVSIIDGIRQAIGADHVITTTNLRVPIGGNIALAEFVKADYLFTDSSKSKHGLKFFMQTMKPDVATDSSEVSDTGTVKKPDYCRRRDV